MFQNVYELKWNLNQEEGYIQLSLGIKNQVKPKWIGFGLS